MAQTCTVCRHPERDAINAALIRREPFRRLAARTGTTSTSLRRHKASHLPVTLMKAVREVEVIRATSLVEKAEMFQAKTLSILAKAEAANDLHTALAAIREGRANAVLLEHCYEKEREENSPEQQMKRLEAENQMLSRQLNTRVDQRELLNQQIVRRNQLLRASHKVLDLFEED